MTDTMTQQGTPKLPLDRDARCPFDPPPVGRALQAGGPIARVQLGDGRPVWYVTRWHEARTLLADPRLSSDATNPAHPSTSVTAQETGSAGLSFILQDDPDHARLRRMVTGPFAVKRIAAMRPRVQQIADELIDEMLANGNTADLVEDFALPLPSMVIADLLGVDYGDHAFFQRNSKAIVSRTASDAERAEAFATLGAFLGELLQERITTPADDLSSELGRRVTGGDLSSEEAVEMGILLLLAGHETTANMIALGTLAILQHPDQRALLEDPSETLVASAVEELLRYLTITHDGRKRWATADIEIGGVRIGRGDAVVVATDLANRDVDAFPEPDRLDLERGSKNHLAFGFGVHQCLGQPLARMELSVVYETLFRRIPTLTVTAPLERIPFKSDAAVYGVHELPVAWCPVH